MADAPSLASDFFDRITGAPDSVAFLRALINSTPPTFETDFLDFKADPGDERNRKAVWYEALSGFANNEGGVLVWGIDARKDPATNIDAACAEVPVTNPTAFQSRLIELQRAGTNPPLGNVRIRSCELPDKPGTGFVVSLIPEGPFKPYRAEIQGRPQYYLRAGDSFIIPTPSMLRVLFYPRTYAVFQVKAILRAELDRTTRRPERIVAQFTVANVGTGTPRDACMLIDVEGIRLAPSVGGDGVIWGNIGRGADLRFVAHRALHPGSVSDEIRLLWGNPACLDDIGLTFRFYAENQVEQRARIVFPLDAWMTGGFVERTATAETT
jgi:hypothetical protein